MVTGSADRLSRKTALELASGGFNLMLISRTQVNLDVVAEEIQQLTGGSANMTGERCVLIQQELNNVWVKVLVNNVDMYYDFPMYVEGVEESTVNSLVELNFKAMVKMTGMDLSHMKRRKPGLIVNMGLFSGLLPCSLLSVYSGTKGFVKYFSQSLAVEVKPHRVVEDHIQALRIQIFFIHLPGSYIEQMLDKIGV